MAGRALDRRVCSAAAVPAACSDSVHAGLVGGLAAHARWMNTAAGTRAAARQVRAGAASAAVARPPPPPPPTPQANEERPTSPPARCSPVQGAWWATWSDTDPIPTKLIRLFLTAPSPRLPTTTASAFCSARYSHSRRLTSPAAHVVQGVGQGGAGSGGQAGRAGTAGWPCRKCSSPRSQVAVLQARGTTFTLAGFTPPCGGRR